MMVPPEQAVGRRWEGALVAVLLPLTMHKIGMTKRSHEISSPCAGMETGSASRRYVVLPVLTTSAEEALTHSDVGLLHLVHRRSILEPALWVEDRHCGIFSS